MTVLEAKSVRPSATILPADASDLNEIVSFQMEVNGMRYPESARRSVTDCFEARLEVTGQGLGWLARDDRGDLVAMALGCWTNLTADTIGDLTDASAADTREIFQPDGASLYVLNLAVDRVRAQRTNAPLNVGRRMLTLLYSTALIRGCRSGLGHSRIPSLRETVMADEGVSSMLRLWAHTLTPGHPIDYSPLEGNELAELDRVTDELAGLSDSDRTLDPTVRYYGMLGGSAPVRSIRGSSDLDHDSLGYSVLQAGRPDRVRTLVSLRL